ncbi:hypothetical protein NC652_020815 [Populus alba x Populus x berolinensis]|nr:hypothetical protein NC652_020815 [Populus alba x Populus x berolinensis]
MGSHTKDKRPRAQAAFTAPSFLLARSRTDSASTFSSHSIFSDFQGCLSQVVYQICYCLFMLRD